MASTKSRTGDRADDDNNPDFDSKLSIDDKETVKLVDRVKAILEERTGKNEPITEDDIELATTDARYERKPYIKKWENDRSIDTTSPDSYDLVKQAIAYAAKPEEINPILEGKQKQRKENPDAYTKKICLRTSIDNILEPLKTLKRKFESPNLKNLFAAVLEIDPDKIDRADRMFFIEARRLLPDPKGYTLDHAHDQVQAIRLMHYETDDPEELRTFIKKCPTFECAYSHLQGLTRERVEKRTESASSARPSSNTNTSKSIVGKSYDNKNIDNSSPPDSAGLYNSDLRGNSPTKNQGAGNRPPQNPNDGRNDRYNGDQDTDRRSMSRK